MKTPTGYVALRRGRNNVRNCIFLNWFDAEIHISDFDKAEYSVIDSLQEAERFIATTSADCTTRNIEETNAMDTSPGQAPVVNSEIETTTTATATLSPPPLPPITIDIDVTDATPSGNPLAKNRDSNEITETFVDMTAPFPSTALKEKFSVAIPTSSTPCFPQIRQIERNGNSHDNDNMHQKLGESRKQSSFLPDSKES